MEMEKSKLHESTTADGPRAAAGRAKDFTYFTWPISCAERVALRLRDATCCGRPSILMDHG
jgi:hypothetical protein